jgi:hypothetical protein
VGCDAKANALVRGEGLREAQFSLSDRALRVDKVVTSHNGHWAQLWLSASPARPEMVTLRAKRAESTAEMSYTFAARRPSNEGLAGFSSRDVLYLIMTDRFADGDTSNDGPDAKSSSSSADATCDCPGRWPNISPYFTCILPDPVSVPEERPH